METQKQLPQAVNTGIVQAAAAAPAALGAAALQGQEAPEQDTTGHEAEMAAEDRTLDAHAQLAKQEHEKELKAMELAGQIRITQEQGKNAETTARIAGENQLKVQKAKPKPKATKAA